MKWNNGDEGNIGKSYLWNIDDIEQFNNDYKIQYYFGSNCYGFGTDGGDKCFCFDDKNRNKIIKCGLGYLDYNETEIISDTFFEFIKRMDKELV
jgi:hypothetical protein